MSLAVARLTEERKQWRKDHPFGFYAKPVTLPDGTMDMMRWECGIPGKPGTLWENGLYKLFLTFSDSYPAAPPKVAFAKPAPHPNVYKDGGICLNLLKDAWKPSITIKQILLGVQELLGNPNLKSQASPFYADMMRNSPKMYEQEVKKYAASQSVTVLE